MRVLNREQLLAHGMRTLRESALDLVECGLTASDASVAVQRLVALDGDYLNTPVGTYNLREFRRIVVIGAGKASLAIARALDDLLGARIASGVVVVPEGQQASLRHIEVIHADHPFPTRRSYAAARRALALAQSTGEHDLLIGCVTGGSSALLALPPPGVDLDAKARLHQHLLSCGAPIEEINTVRKHVSLIKAGRLAAASAGARILNLTVSDVSGDALDLITDPTVPEASTPEDAIGILTEWDLWDEVSPAIRTHLTRDAAQPPTLAGRDIRTVVLVSGDSVCAELHEAAKRRGMHGISLGPTLDAPGAHLGSILAELGRASLRQHQPFPGDAILFACGGESTVSLGSQGQYGGGGPNQELALAAALRLREEEAVALVAIDTDGSDGGTDHAGAIIDGATLQRAHTLHIDPRQALREHRSTAPFQALGDLVSTGPTGTNVNDLVVMALGNPQ